MLIEQYLLYLAAPPHRIGFDQLVFTLQYLLQHPEAKHLYGEIYPAVAEKFGTTVSCIDHNLRTVIETIWLYGDAERLHALGCGSGNYRPSNKMFLFALTRRLRLLESSPDLIPDTLFDTADAMRAAAQSTLESGQSGLLPL